LRNVCFYFIAFRELSELSVVTVVTPFWKFPVNAELLLYLAKSIFFMHVVDQIKAPISEEMEVFQGYFKKAMKTEVPLLNVILQYILKRKGKQMRPMFVFLSAKLFTEQVSESSYTAASLIELLHTATLIHDDVVDESYVRRGAFSINALWKSKISVLVGDYLLAQGLLLSVDKNEHEILRIVSRAVKDLSEGELLQTQKSRKLNITEEEYYKIIRKKTAALIAACTAAGAQAAGAKTEQIEKMYQFGIYVGMAFQVKDDLFDYQRNGSVGKPTGNDIKEKKITLPLIHALNEASSDERRKILRIVKHHNKNSKKVSQVVDFVEQKGGLAYADKKMKEFISQGLEILADFSDSPAKNSLIALTEYVSTRKK